MDRAEATGLGIAVAGHGVLLAVLSLGFATATKKPLLSEPMEVSFVEEVGLKAAVTEVNMEAPAASVAPVAGPPEEAAPQSDPVPAPPEPLPPPPKPEPPAPQPKIQPPPQPKLAPKPAPPKPAPQPAPAKPSPARAAAAPPVPAKPAPARPAQQAARPTAARPTQTAAGSGSAQQTRGSRLGQDFLKGIGSDPKPATSERPSGAVLSPVALAGIKSAITRQIQPCADRQVNPGPGANEIVVTLNLRLRPDGSLASPPTKIRTAGVDDGNRRYENRVVDLAIAAYTGCSPLRDLPEELYRTANGGWSNINMNYKLP